MTGQRFRRAVALLAVATAVGLSLLAAASASAATGKALVFMGNSPGVPATPTYTQFAQATGKTIDTLTTLPANLGEYDCVVLSVNNATFSAAQKSALSGYVNGGGRLLALAEYGTFPTNAIAAMNDLASALGSTMAVVPAVIGQGELTTTNIDSHALTTGVASIRWGAASRVSPGSGSSLVRSPDGQTILAAEQLGGGYLVLSGDHNMFSDHIDTGYTTHDNGKLAANICGAAGGGGEEPSGCDVSGSAALNLLGGGTAYVNVNVRWNSGEPLGYAAYVDPIALVFVASVEIEELECTGGGATIRGRAWTNRFGTRPFVMSVGAGGTVGPSGDSAGITVASYGRSGTAGFGNLAVTPA